MNKLTRAERAYERERERNLDIDRALRYRERTGNCPMCHRPAAWGVTCGDMLCLRAWLAGKLPRLEIVAGRIQVYKEADHGRQG